MVPGTFESTHHLPKEVSPGGVTESDGRGDDIVIQELLHVLEREEVFTWGSHEGDLHKGVGGQ